MDDDYWEPPDYTSHKEVRATPWTKKDGSSILINDMADSHLLAAYKLTGDNLLLREMIVRLFETRNND